MVRDVSKGLSNRSFVLVENEKYKASTLTPKIFFIKYFFCFRIYSLISLKSIVISFFECLTRVNKVPLLFIIFSFIELKIQTSPRVRLLFSENYFGSIFIFD